MLNSILFFDCSQAVFHVVSSELGFRLAHGLIVRDLALHSVECGAFGMVANGGARIVRFAKLVGKENVIACTDCGLRHLPDASLAFAKLYALSEGARLATRELWN